MEYDGGGRARSAQETIHKLLLLPFVSEAFESAVEVEMYKKEKIPKNRKCGAEQKGVEYWAFVVRVGAGKRKKVRVIARRVGGGRLHFWSVMSLRAGKKWS
jgi:hypothetical protein